MNKTVVGAILLFILITAGAAAVKFIAPYIEESQRKSSSDAAKSKGKIRMDMDNWIGYFPLRSREMKKMLHRHGYTLEVNDDNADYTSRMTRLDNGETDFAVATVDSYILNGAKENFPGTIIMVIDESKGGDAILARKEKIDSLDSLRDKSDIRIAFTPDSPSHHLAKAASDHFGLSSILPTGQFRIETEGSKAAYDKLLSGKTDVAICWEPDVSKALENKGIIKLLGTEDTQRLIVDILIVNRRFAEKKPDVVTLFMETYFKVLKQYRDNPDSLKQHVKKETGLNTKMVDSMLKGVEWVNFTRNCNTWFGISSPGESSDEGLIDTIESTVSILKNTGDFNKSPVPDQDPYRLTNSSFLESLFNKRSGFTTPGAGKKGAVNTLGASFKKLPVNQWETLKEVGTLKIEPVSFQRGASDLDMLGAEVLDRMADRLKHYPNFRVMIKAHTGVRGDKKANRELSQKRAEAVDKYLMDKYGLDPNRTLAMGYGGSNPLKRKSGESKRAWSYRLPRVEIALVREEF